MGSGLIYAVIIVMWAAYFIPRWLRRHEELSESRSVEKFDHAMRILSRRDPTPDQRYIVMPPRPAESSSGRAKAGRPRSTAERRAASIAVRRRRVLAALLLLTVSLAVAVSVSPLPWWAPVPLLVVAVADLVHLRLQARRRLELTRTRHAVRKRTRSRLRRFDSAERIVEARRVLGERRAAAEAERVEAEWAAQETVRLQTEREAADAMGWQPTPVPLPTYVTKPMAPRVGRPIDLTVPGKWTEAQGDGRTLSDELFDQSRSAEQTTPASEASYDDYVEELEAILERRRAVND